MNAEPARMSRHSRELWCRVSAHLRSWWVLSCDAATSLVQRPGHTIGMMSGITLAVASATAALVIADTQQARIDLRFDLQRSDRVVLQATNLPADGFPVRQVQRSARLGPVSDVGELSIWSQSSPVTRSLTTQPVSAPVVVADAGGLRASGTVGVAGASTALLSVLNRQRTAWVGSKLAEQLGVEPVDASGDGDAQVVVQGHPFSVAGVLANDGAFGYLSSAVVISRATAVRTFGSTGENVRLVAHVRPGSARAVGAYLLRTVDLDGSIGLRDVTPPDGQRLVSTVGRDLRRIGTALAAIVGLVGIMSVANTLMLSVHQRVRELGLRSAMGWTRRRIGSLILLESAVAGLLAGVMGAAVGLAAAAGWSVVQGWELIVEPTLPLLVTACAVLGSLAGGIVPALRATATSPMEAMRS